MPIPVTCECGRSMKVKDEMAGKRGKCPSCGQMLLIPKVEKKPELEEDAGAYLLADSPVEEKPRPRDEFRQPPDRAAEEDSAPRPEWKRRKEKRESRRENKERTRIVFEEGWFGSINSGMVGGLLMMVIAVVWFFGALAVGVIFIYPPILFFIGLASLVKGLTGRE